MCAFQSSRSGNVTGVSPRKSERIMNLAICLLMARRFIEKSQIRQVVEGYHDLSDSAFERTFERDKDELRAMGVPVETGSNNPLFPDDVGYRIRRKDFELPAIEFTPAETAALGLAATVWESATQAEHATQTQDPVELARRVRIALSPAIVQQIYGPTRELSVIAIEPGLERLLVQALGNAAAPALDPGVADLLTQKAAEVALQQEEMGMPACLLVPDAIRGAISRLVRRVAPRLQVLAHSEIPETHTIRIGPILKGALP